MHRRSYLFFIYIGWVMVAVAVLSGNGYIAVCRIFILADLCVVVGSVAENDLSEFM